MEPESNLKDEEVVSDYVIWHSPQSCDHLNENCCIFCDVDGWYRENYSPPKSLPGRGNRLEKKMVGNERTTGNLCRRLP